MNVVDPVLVQRWRAELALEFERRDGRTVLARRRHEGPLVVQKPLYPEGESTCHSILVHPPGGMAGGDELIVDARVGPHAQVLLTTPAAAKWYRSLGPWAKQRTRIDGAAGACAEWLPQESIVFDGARAEISLDVKLHGDAVFVGWDAFCLGRAGSGEAFTRGECCVCTHLSRDDKAIFFERGHVRAGDRFFASPAGLDEHTVFGAFLAASEAVDRALLQRCRGETADKARTAVTHLPGVLIARYLGDSTQEARDYFQRIWQHVRPALAAKPAKIPRIWNT
jgi:urease accessory protein